MQTRSLFIPACALAFGATGALAGSGPPGDRDATIESLRDEVIELRATVARMRDAQEAAALPADERRLAEARAVEVKALVAEALADADTRASLLQDGMTAGYDKGFFLRSADGNWLLRVKGQLDIRYTWNHANDQGTLPAPEPDDLYGFEVRRAKLSFTGNIVDPSWEYEIKGAFNAGGGGFVLDEAWLAKSFENGFALKTGQFKLPFLLEENTSSSRQLAIDRSFVNELYNQDRAKGLQGGYAADQWRVWSAYSDGFNSDVTTWDAATSNSFTGRFDWKFMGDWKQFADMTSFPGSEDALMVGGAVNWQQNKYGAKTQRFSWTLDASWKSNGWNAFAYVTGNHLDPAAGTSADQFGAVFQGGYFFTDEWEVFGRYEYSDLDGASATGAALPSANDEVSIVTAGVNWYIDKHNLKWQTDIGIGLDAVPLDQNGIGWRQDAPGEDGQLVVRSQFQLLF